MFANVGPIHSDVGFYSTSPTIMKCYQLLKEVQCETSKEHFDHLQGWINHAFENGILFWNDQRYNNRMFLSAESSIVTELFNRFVPIGSNVLELGANILSAKGQSSLSSLLGINHPYHFIFSDAYSRVFEAEKRKTTNKYLLIKAQNLSQDLASDGESSKQEVITALNVVATIEKGLFPEVAKEVFCSLKNKGIFIILADNFPHPGNLLPCAGENIRMPWIRYTESGKLERFISTVPFQSFNNNIKEMLPQMSPEHMVFFNKFLELTLLQQQIFLAKACYTDCEDVMSMFEGFRHSRDTITEELSLDAYNEELENSLRAAGFQITLNATQRKDEKISNKSWFNSFEMKFGEYIDFYRQAIPPHEAIVTSNMHVIIAQKP